MTKLVIGNWKLNPVSLAEAESLAGSVVGNKSYLELKNVVLLPPFIFLEELVKKFPQLQWGAQDFFWAREGAYTGEISLEMLKNIGAKWVLVGHSERRRYFGETDQSVNKKMSAALAQNFNVIVAVGELQKGDSSNLVTASLKESISGASPKHIDRLVIAYEPVWAIGTGEADDPVRSNRIISELKQTAFKMFGSASGQIRFLYGGSLTGANAEQFLGQEYIDGALVGGASLKTDDFGEIINIASRF